jgi:acrylyl-CoA reductase (NADPH)
VSAPGPVRAAAWARLDSLVPRTLLELVTTEAPLAEVPLRAELILAGSVRGRVVVNVDGAGA